MLRLDGYNPKTENERLLAAITVAAGGDRAIIYRFDKASAQFVKSAADQDRVSLNTKVLNDKYREAYSFDAKNRDITGLCSLHNGELGLDPKKNIRTLEGQALYIPIESNGGMLLIVIEKLYRWDGNVAYRVEEYVDQNREFVVSQPKFSEDNVRAASFIARTYRTCFFSDAKNVAESARVAKKIAVDAEYAVAIETRIAGFLKRLFVSREMKDHVENVARVSKMLLSKAMKSDSVLAKKMQTLLPVEFKQDSSWVTYFFQRMISHDCGKGAEREDTVWTGDAKSDGQSIRSRQHPLISWILMETPCSKWAVDIARHHTEYGYFNDSSVLSATAELADKFDAMTGPRTAEKYRPMTVIEAMARLAETVIEFDEDFIKYEASEKPNLNPRKTKAETKICAKTPAMLYLALANYIELDVFRDYGETRNGDFLTYFSNVKDRETNVVHAVQQATEETAGNLSDESHTLAHLRPLGGYSNSIARIAKRAQIVTGNQEYDQYLSVEMQGQAPDTYEQIKAKILTYLKEKVLSREDIQQQLRGTPRGTYDYWAGLATDGHMAGRGT